MTFSPIGTLGIDFGTSNSAMTWLGAQASARLITLEGNALVMTTAVFYNTEKGSTHFGQARLRVSNMQAHLRDLLARTVACSRKCVRRASLTDASLDEIYLTGGSSALSTFQAEFTGVPLVDDDLFGSVARSLAHSR